MMLLISVTFWNTESVIHSKPINPLMV